MKVSGPDGVEAWCVAMSAFFINLVMAGLGRTSGVFYVAFIDIFAIDRLQASIPFSARQLSRNLLGPVVGILGQKYGVRAATVMGGVLGTISAVACFYASDILWITIMWGLMNGIGTALTTTLHQVVLGLHFKKYRTTASGIAYSGECVGAFLLPVLLEYLLRTYGLGGMFLILSGIIMNVIPAAMFLRKPSWIVKKPTVKPIITLEDCDKYKRIGVVGESQKVEKSSLEVADKFVCGHSNAFHNYERDGFESFNSVSEVILSRTTLADKLPDKYMIDFKFLLSSIGTVTKLLNKGFCHHNKTFDCKNNLCLSNEISVNSIKDIFEYLQQLWTDNFTSLIETSSLSVKCSTNNYSLSKLNQSMTGDKKENMPGNVEMVACLIEQPSKVMVNDNFLSVLHNLMKEDYSTVIQSFSKHNNNISKLLEQLVLIHTFLEGMKSRTASPSVVRSNTDISRMKCNENDSKQSNKFSTYIKIALRLHTNPMFLLISLSRSVHFITFVQALTIIVDFTMDKGLLEEDGKYVLAALSVGDLMGRLCLGWITDKKFIGLPRYMFVAMILQCACTVSVSFMYSREILLFAIALFGLFQGSLFVRHPVLVSKYLDKNEQSVAMGCINLFSGLLGFTLPNYIGYFRDTIGCYDYIFYINGSIGAFVGSLWIFEPYFRKRCKRNLNDND